MAGLFASKETIGKKLKNCLSGSKKGELFGGERWRRNPRENL